MLAGPTLLEQVVVIGDRRRYRRRLIVPVFPVLERHAKEHGIPFTSREELVTHPLVVALYESRIRDLSTELANYEQVKRYTLVDKEFTQEGGQLTPSLKLKRKVIELEYAAIIDAMYDAPRRESAAS